LRGILPLGGLSFFL